MSNTERLLYHLPEKRYKGRPLKVRTGLKGRPRKLPAKSSVFIFEAFRDDRESLTELLSRLRGPDPDRLRFVTIEKKNKKPFS